MLTTKRLADIAPGVKLKEHLTLCQTGIRLPTLALKLRDVTRSPKQGYDWPHKKDLCPPKFKIKSWKKNFFVAWNYTIVLCVQYADVNEYEIFLSHFHSKLKSNWLCGEACRKLLNFNFSSRIWFSRRDMVLISLLSTLEISVGTVQWFHAKQHNHNKRKDLSLYKWVIYFTFKGIEKSRRDISLI